MSHDHHKSDRACNSREPRNGRRQNASRRRTRRRRGTAVVEFALVAPLFFLFIFGMIEWLWFFDDGSDFDDNFDDGQFVYSLGVGFNF